MLRNTNNIFRFFCIHWVDSAHDCCENCEAKVGLVADSTVTARVRRSAGDEEGGESHSYLLQVRHLTIEHYYRHLQTTVTTDET